jgi:small subunit ribosomal protein S20
LPEQWLDLTGPPRLQWRGRAGFSPASHVATKELSGPFENNTKAHVLFLEIEIFMANHLSALKRIRQDEKRTEFNRRNTTRLRHQIRSMRKLIAAKNADGALKLLPETFSVIDRSAKLGVIKKNTAARYKSKLHHHIKLLATK